MMTYLYFKNLMSFGLPLYPYGRLDGYMQKFEIGLDNILWDLNYKGKLKFINQAMHNWSDN